ncbi:MAG: prephenate dehydrogenase/arogenate dehydrogenase family protein [Candidatus Hadarchaeum sp.]|uniref:prephenate dehydrogenase/arogenate dehydrogenase family protein n=1 Tax=Candidatus Hadarchaeum sp. TaxID=2883567 RepID=UPI00316B63C7
MKTAVIGAGEMGKWLAKFSKRLGEVVVSDVNRLKARKLAAELKVKAALARNAAAEADIIFIAVPISATPKVLLEVAGEAKSGALIADVASVKLEVVKTMERIEKDVELVSIHPLFGPGASSLKNKDVVAIPVRPGKRYRKLKELLRSDGARVIEMDAELHDRTMAVVQCLSHFILLSYVQALRALNGGKISRRMRTPMFSALVELAKAASAGKPELYLEIQQQNKYSELVRQSAIEAFHSLNALLARGDLKAVRTIVGKAVALFGRNEVKRAYADLYRRFEGGGP